MAEDLDPPIDHMSPPTRHGVGTMIHTHQVELAMAVVGMEVVHMRAAVEDYHQGQEDLDKEVLAYPVGRDRRGDRFGLFTMIRSAGVGVGLMFWFGTTAGIMSPLQRRMTLSIPYDLHLLRRIITAKLQIHPNLIFFNFSRRLTGCKPR